MSNKCLVCGREFTSKKGLCQHLSQTHKLKYKEYYDKYIKTEPEGKCPICGTKTPFTGNGYKLCCSSTCTCLYRYGVPHNSQIPEVKAKMHTKEAHQKQRDTISKVYGIDCIFNREDVRQKTNIASHSPEAMAKRQATCQEKYGVNSPLEIKEIHEKGIAASKTEEVKDKIKQTNLERRGVVCPLNTPEVKAKANSSEAKLKRNESNKKTNLERRGVEWPAQDKEVFEKQKETNLEKYGTPYPFISEKGQLTKAINKQNTIDKLKLNHYTDRQQLIAAYGQGWLSLDILYTIENRMAFVDNAYIPTIEAYCNRDRGPNLCSAKEQEIKSILGAIYHKPIKYNYRLAINPLELDIYLPDIKLGIEYNGTYWHSTEYKNKNYHLNKSLRCREKGIRLVHIYEFEDFDTQIKLLKDLINGIDNYPKTDFNKNNLMYIIPTPEIIYNNGRYIVYGAGPLVK